MISGTTALVAHVGYPMHTFKSSLICNPWFEKNGVDAVVVPMGIKAEDYLDFFRSAHTHQHPRCADHYAAQGDHHGAGRRDQPDRPDLRRDQRSIAAGRRVACRSVRRRRLCPRCVAQGFDPSGKRALVVAAAASLHRSRPRWRACGLAEIGLFDPNTAASGALAQRIGMHYPDVKVAMGSKDPEGYDLIVNATPIGMKDDDPLPVDIDRVTPGAYVGDVVLKADITPLLQAAKDKGCTIQVGSDMLFELIPAYLEFFGFGNATPDELRATAQLP